MSEYTRNCPVCGKQLVYKTKKSLSVCTRTNTTCKECRPRPKSHRAWLGRTHSKETIEKIRKAATGRPGPNKGKPKSEETKRKMRIAAISWIEKNKGQCGPKYNPKACELFDKINQTMGWNGLHAKNEGEFYIKSLGYWVDYYEPSLNLVIEYDEKYHQYSNYNRRDSLRQTDIMKLLNCRFIRINEDDTLDIIYNKIKEVL